VQAAHLSANLHPVGVARALKASTNARGQAALTLTPKRAGSIPVKVAKSGFATKTLKVKVSR
jgi:hypothetical protein